MDKRKSWKIRIEFLILCTVAVAGVLLAPKSGEETREMLGDMAADIAKKTDAKVKDIQKKADDIVSDVQEKSEEIMSKLQDMLGKNEEQQA